MDPDRSRKMRWWIPCLIVLFVAGPMVLAGVEESFLRFYAYTFLPVLGLILLANWYVFATDLPGDARRRLFLGGMLGFFAVAGILGGFFRWDDTWGGTSLIKPTWRWAPRKEDKIASASPKASTAVSEAKGEIEGVLRDWPRYLGEQGDGVVRGIR
ncbi:MAG: hypothetical protein ABL994_20910, partial [Verrucomicrobiales bacterium]